MWIQVRSMDGKISHRIDDLSKLTKIEELRPLLVDKFSIPVNLQRLFYRGKQLEDGHTLFDYDVGLNDIVQILARQSQSDSDRSSSEASQSSLKNKENKSADFDQTSENLSKYFKVGDLIDAKDPTNGAWFEAKVIAVKMAENNCKQILHSAENSPVAEKHNASSKGSEDDDNLIYKVVFEDYEDDEGSMDLTLKSLRPRARKVMKFEDVKVGDSVMINYNIEEPSDRGFWYDCVVTGKNESRTKNTLIGTLMIGCNETKLEGCKIKFTDEIFAIEKNSIANGNAHSIETILRAKMPKCSHCKDIPSKKCKMCSCHVCGGKDAPDKQIMCDECDFPYHIWCLQPPLSAIPEADDWYCPDCKNDETEVVRAGEKLKTSKKKSKMASANSSTSRDWGKGMACVGRTKECTIVPPNHFGPIPGVEVGTMWKFRLQVSESGIHRPHVAGIHGRESEGAYSIVLSGGYEDDLDNGDEFYYTGSGGRDLSGNKRCAEQSCDQTLTRMNKALASNCNAPLNKNGTESKEWKQGKPVRVVRNCKGRKHSKYSPEEGNRYDGIYKIVKYWPEKGKSGFLVWRYLLRRDDPTPAPWTSAGKKRIKELGLEIQYPEGYLESLKEKEKEAEESTPNKKSKKREHSVEKESPASKKKKKAYEMSKETQSIIKKDKINKKMWDECLEHMKEGQQELLKKIEMCFQCICCQELVFQPITTPCLHNICKVCLKRSFSAKVYTCPMCRQDLEVDIVSKTNTNLQKALLLLFPGYDAGR